MNNTRIMNNTLKTNINITNSNFNFNLKSKNVQQQIAKLKEILFDKTITNSDELKNNNKALPSDSDEIIINKANKIANYRLEDIEHFKKIQTDQEKYLQELRKLRLLEKFHFPRELNNLIEQAKQMIENTKGVIKINEKEAHKILGFIENIRESSIVKGGKRTTKKRKIVRTKKRNMKKGKRQ